MFQPKNHKVYVVNSRFSSSYFYYFSVYIHFTFVYAVASGASLGHLFNYIFVFIPNILRKYVKILKARVKLSSPYAQRAVFHVG